MEIPEDCIYLIVCLIDALLHEVLYLSITLNPIVFYQDANCFIADAYPGIEMMR